MSKLEDTLARYIRYVDLPEPEREYRFDTVRRWRFDFAWPSLKLAVECEGGTWMKKSRHTSGAGFEKDCEKYNAAALQGWKVLRFTTGMITSGEALNTIEQAIGQEIPAMLRSGGLI